jgi:pyruvate formate lyase activating enzyme
MTNKATQTGRIFQIQQFSLHDGPGIRTLVFFKGCPMACLWCSNPESQAVRPTLLWYGNRCIGCLYCQAACTNGAISQEGGLPLFNRDNCMLCGRCEKVCYAKAIQIVGEDKSVDEVMDVIRKDLPFYGNDGGVTLSGGEATLQWEFACSLLDACGVEGISTSIETCGYGVWENIEKVLSRVDLILFDIKHMDPFIHRRLTKVDNTLILENCKKASRLGKKMIIRVPVIPTMNDDKNNIKSIVEFVKRLETVKEIHLLPYHNYGSAKYLALGEAYAFDWLKKPLQKDMEALLSFIEDAGFIGKIGG